MDVFLRQDEEDTIIDTVEPTLTPAWHNKLLTTQPNGQNWTWDSVNQMEAGWAIAVVPDVPYHRGGLAGRA